MSVPWHRSDDAELYRLSESGLSIYAIADQLPGHDWLDVSERRTDLQHRGLWNERLLTPACGTETLRDRPSAGMQEGFPE